jgi:hypothetical protein
VVIKLQPTDSAAWFSWVNSSSNSGPEQSVASNNSALQGSSNLWLAKIHLKGKKVNAIPNFFPFAQMGKHLRD